MGSPAPWLLARQTQCPQAAPAEGTGGFPKEFAEKPVALPCPCCTHEPVKALLLEGLTQAPGWHLRDRS